MWDWELGVGSESALILIVILSEVDFEWGCHLEVFERFLRGGAF